MFGNVLYFVISCWLYVSCAATLKGQHVPIDRNLQLVDFSMLSETCANETQNITGELNEIFSPSGYWDCIEGNTTGWICQLNANTYRIEMDCTDLGGQAHENFTQPDYYRCINENTGDNIRFGVISYPICTGLSCNETEAESVFDETISADLSYGSFGSPIQILCNSSIPLSASTNLNGIVKYVIIYLTFTTLAFAIYAL